MCEGIGGMYVSVGGEKYMLGMIDGVERHTHIDDEYVGRPINYRYVS